MERLRALGAMLVTAPTEDERLFEMSVRIPRSELRPHPGYTLSPCLTIRANTTTGAITCGIDFKAKRIGEC